MTLAAQLADQCVASTNSHPEVWLLIARGHHRLGDLLGSRMRSGHWPYRPGEPVVSLAQTRFFIAGVRLLWLSLRTGRCTTSAEEHLYFVHMVQHLLITIIVPPLLLLAMPAWLARLLILDDGRPQRILRRFTRPLVAGVIFNALQILTHWGEIVRISSENGAFHYVIHLAVFVSALLMWFPVLGPLREMQMSEPGKCLYLFLMSIVPTVPAGWLTFAEGIVYQSYDTADPLWGISPRDDQQAAGAVMKVLGGFYLWVLIAIRFFRWTGVQRVADEQERRRRRQERLTLEALDRELEAP